jgi:dimethylaniline monooxygenase (N-oxide forming)
MRVCVIGAGAAGLVTAKHLLEEGFTVEILEKRDGLGGLWYFSKDQKESGVSDKTFATSSKTFLQFSDFPMEPSMDFFPHHADYIKYLKEYVQAFHMEGLIKYGYEVLHLHKSAKGWHIKVRHGDEVYDDCFDAVAVCSGLHHVPLIPEIPGIDEFEGLNIHSSFIKDAAQELAGKRVVVVGGGESAADLVHELASAADTVYMSLKRGMAVTRHWSIYPHLPGDFDSTRAKVWLPREFLHDFNMSCRLKDQYSAFKTIYTLVGLPVFLVMLSISYKKTVETLRSLFDPHTWTALFQPQARYGPACGVELTKAYKQLCAEPPKTQEEISEKAIQLKYTLDWYSGTMHNSQPFTKRYAFLEDLVQGKGQIAPAIKAYTGGRNIEFEDGSTAEVDAVVFCTGFQSLLPFLQDYLEDQKLDGRSLYKNVFLPGESTLGFVGFVRPNVGSLPAVAEMQARWFVGTLAGKCQLPSMDKMKKTVMMDSDKYTMSRPHHVNRATSLVDYHAYMEEIASMVGCQLQVWRFLLHPGLLIKLLFGPMACFQYRFHGYGAKPDVAMKALQDVPSLPIDRIVQHSILYVVFKPWFFLFNKLGWQRFRPVF